MQILRRRIVYSISNTIFSKQANLLFAKAGAKILLFSAVHHMFDLSGQDWSLLRTCDFDDLLQAALLGSPTVIALEIRLSAIAQALFEPKEHLQATSALIQAIKLLSQSSATP